MFAGSLPNQEFRQDQCFVNGETLAAHNVSSGQSLLLSIGELSFRVVVLKMAAMLPDHVLVHSQLKRILQDQVQINILSLSWFHRILSLAIYEQGTS